MSQHTDVGLPDFDPAAYQPGDSYDGDYQAEAECGWKGARTRDYAAARDELKAHVATGHPAEAAAATEFYRHAEQHYNDGGWDVIVETRTVAEIAESFAAEGITTLAAALKRSVLTACVDVWADQEADARFHQTESYCGFQGEHAWCHYPPRHDGDTHSDGTPVRERTPDGYPR